MQNSGLCIDTQSSGLKEKPLTKHAGLAVHTGVVY